MYGCSLVVYLFFKDTATTESYTYSHTLSLHDALPIFVADRNAGACGMRQLPIVGGRCDSGRKYTCTGIAHRDHRTRPGGSQEKRSEEHTSELQSLMRNSYAVFCLNKKKKQNTDINIMQQPTYT